MTYIFDLGGVLVNINMKEIIRMQRWMLSFRTLLRGKKFIQREIKSLYKEYEFGHLSTEEFLTRYKKHCHRWISRDTIRMHWTRILLDFPEQRKAALRKLKADGNTIYLLSNTCELHWQHCLDTYFAGEDIHNYFDRLFLSYEIGMRKPDQHIYEYVIETTNCNPQETIYFDDLPSNIEGGLKAGLQAKLAIGDQWLDMIHPQDK